MLLVSPTGEALRFKALIDHAVEGSFISESATQALSLRKKPQRLRISGVGADVKASQGSTVQVCISSICDKASSVSVSAAVLPKLTCLLPKQPLIRCEWPHLYGLILTDPNYHQPAGIDSILDA